MTSVHVAPTARTMTAVVLAGATVAVALTALVAASLAHANFNTCGGIIVGAVLTATSLPLIRWATTRAGEPQLTGLLSLALACKLGGSLVRYFVTFELYKTGDSIAYSRAGAALAPYFRNGVFSVSALGPRTGTGTRFLEIATGVVYTFTGPTNVGGFLVFAWLGFWGLYLCYRAFRVAVPEGDHRRYAVLLFFLPTSLYWSSSIGKDTWMIFVIGLSVYGAAQLLTGKLRGAPMLALGLAGASAVRAHIGILLAMGLLVAMLIARFRRPNVARAPLRLAVIALLLIVGALAVAQLRDQLQTNSLSPSALQAEFDEAARRSDEGGSRFSPAARGHAP